MIVINPSSGCTLYETGESFEFTAKATFNDGSQLSFSSSDQGAVWNSTDPAIAVVSAAGIVTAVSNGMVSVSCSYGGKSGTVEVIVDAPVFTGIRIDPFGSFNLGCTGTSASFKAFGVYSRGDDVELTEAVSWSVDNPAIAVADSSGKVTAVSEGSSDLRAVFGKTETFSGFSASCAINVVCPHPVLSVDSARISFTVNQGGNGSARSFNVSNIGTGSMDFQVLESSEWFDVSTASGTVAEGASASVQINPAASSMSSGEYTEIITVTAEGAIGSPAIITVILTVNELSSELSVDSTTLSVSVTEGSNAGNQSFSVSNTGAGGMDFHVSGSDSWMGFSPASGSLNQGESAVIQVNFSTSSLGAGSYSGSIIITAEGAGGSPKQIQVSLEVEEVDSLGMDFKWIPAGTFMMGSPSDEGNRGSNETQHEVRLSQGYYMQSTEVTNSQYAYFLNSVGTRGTNEEPWFETASEDDDSHIEGSVI